MNGNLLPNRAQGQEVVETQGVRALEDIRRRCYVEERLELNQVCSEGIEQVGSNRVLHDGVAVSGDRVEVAGELVGIEHEGTVVEPFTYAPAMAIYALGDLVPQIDPTAYVHPEATVIGDVHIGPGSTVWPQAVLRGDYGRITVGARTSIQDGSVIHSTMLNPTVIGDDCVIGHLVHMECCTIGNGALVGSGAVVLHRCVVEDEALVGAAALVPNDMRVPSRAMALGVPAKLRLDAVDPEMMIKLGARQYVQNGARYRDELRRLDPTT